MKRRLPAHPSARGTRPRHARDVRPSVCPALSTADLPGTAGKVEALSQREADGSALFHRHDARLEDSPRLGLRPAARPSNGAASKHALDDPCADGGCTLFHALAEEGPAAPPPPEEISLPLLPTFALLHWLRLEHAQGRAEIRRAP